MDGACLTAVDSIRSRGGCYALVPKSPVHTGTAGVAGSTFVSRPSRSASHLASRWTVDLVDVVWVMLVDSA